MVNKLTILLPFCTNPKKQLHLAELSRLTKIPHPTARLHLEFFEKEGIIKKENKGKLSLFSLDLSNTLTLFYLKQAEIQRTINKLKSDILLNELASQIKFNKAAVIFGSSSTDIKTGSDIDLLFPGKIENIREVRLKLNKNIQHIQTELGIITPALREEIIKKHIILSGFDEAVEWIVNQNGVLKNKD